MCDSISSFPKECRCFKCNISMAVSLNMRVRNVPTRALFSVCLFICLYVCRHSAPSAGHSISQSYSRSCPVFWTSYVERRTSYITAYKISGCVPLILMEHLSSRYPKQHTRSGFKTRVVPTSEIRTVLNIGTVYRSELQNTKMVCPLLE